MSTASVDPPSTLSTGNPVRHHVTHKKRGSEPKMHRHARSDVFAPERVLGGRDMGEGVGRGRGAREGRGEAKEWGDGVKERGEET